MAILALYIIIGIIAVIYILLRFSLRISYSFDSTASTKATVKVKYFFFTLYENPESEKRKIKKAKKAEKKEKKLRKKQIKLDKRNKIQKEKVSDRLVQNEAENKQDIVCEINELSEEETEEKIKELEKEIAEQKVIYEKSLNDSKKGAKKTDKQINKNKSKAKSDNGKNKKAKKESKLSQIKSTWLKIKPYAPLTWKTLRKLLKKIRFYDTEVDILLGNEDPYKAAVNYGYANIAFYQSLAFLCMIFSVKIKSCDFNTEFINKRFEIRLSGNVYVRPSTLLAIVICYGVKMLKIYLSERNKNSYKNTKKDKELLNNEQ